MSAPGRMRPTHSSGSGVGGVLAFVVLLAVAGLLGWWGLSSYSGSNSRSETASSSMPSPPPSAAVSGPVSGGPTASAAGSPPPATAPATLPPAQPIPRGSGAPGVPLPRVDQVDGADPTAVSQAALTTWFTADTVVDTSMQDAVVRAVPWLTPEYARDQTSYTPLAGSRAQWTEWTRHRAYTVVALVVASEAGAPPDAGGEAYRKWLVTVTPHGRDGWVGPPQVSPAFVRLVRASVSDPWRVAEVLVTR
ncbi:hypothetical protein LO772_16370 [Yinghuangia sp. ASG 101]|uniref:hypothetical protein n=1 Tax=Yinghuangia sp. ASG 101 TaxID=2896848 RepID=UPI001E2AB868|nr:hypothetical protein [Yinghuangia sp. ASG 101]UGQ15001.1 hypothetical protein LO772_16370 [Yinghuangia sp. ASG 101]